jgi:hypothetical protein
MAEGRDKFRADEVSMEAPWNANIKRSYDEYQHESLESLRRNRSYVDKVLADAQQHDNQRQDIANQALQNAVVVANKVASNSAETDNMVAKQAVRHGDLSIDRQWNIDEQGYTAASILESDLFKDAVKQAVIAAIASNK